MLSCLEEQPFFLAAMATFMIKVPKTVAASWLSAGTGEVGQILTSEDGLLIANTVAGTQWSCNMSTHVAEDIACVADDTQVESVLGITHLKPRPCLFSSARPRVRTPAPRTKADDSVVSKQLATTPYDAVPSRKRARDAEREVEISALETVFGEDQALMFDTIMARLVTHLDYRPSSAAVRACLDDHCLERGTKFSLL